MGREFLHLIEMTDMQKVYKMPILYGFYNEGNVRLAITDDELLESWKKFFNHGTCLLYTSAGRSASRTGAAQNSSAGVNQQSSVSAENSSASGTGEEVAQ